MNFKKLQSLFFVSMFSCLPFTGQSLAGEDINLTATDEYTMYNQYKTMTKQVENISSINANSTDSDYDDDEYDEESDADMATEINISLTSSQYSPTDGVSMALQSFLDAKKDAGQNIITSPNIAIKQAQNDWDTATALNSAAAGVPNKYIRNEPVLLNDARGIKKTDKVTKENVFAIIQEIHYLKSSVRDMFIDKDSYVQNTPYREVNNSSLMQRNIIPLKFLSPVPNTVVEIQKMSSPWGFTMVNRYNGLITIEGVAPDYKFFRITYSGLPANVCAALLLAKWEDNYLGTMWIGSNGKFYSWARELQASQMPVSPQEAYAVCNSGGYFQIGFK